MGEFDETSKYIRPRENTMIAYVYLSESFLDTIFWAQCSVRVVRRDHSPRIPGQALLWSPTSFLATQTVLSASVLYKLKSRPAYSGLKYQLSVHIKKFDERRRKWARVYTSVGHYNNTYKELKIDSDVVRISGGDNWRSRSW